MLKTTRLSGLSALKAFKAENDKVVGGGGRADEIVVDLSSLVKNCQKSKNLKGLKNLQRLLIWKNQAF